MFQTTVLIFLLLTARYGQAAPGSLDPSFGNGGVFSFPVVSYPSTGVDFVSANAIAIQADGKIVVAGSGYNGANEGFGLARFNVDGSPDLTFGLNGKIVTIFPNGKAFADAVIIQPDGKIVAAGGNDLYYSGTGVEPENYYVLLARYNADGLLDTTFGLGGKIMTDLRSVTYGAADIALQADGKIVTVGRLFHQYGTDFVLVRYNSDGSLDNSFGLTGKITTRFSDNSGAVGVAIQSDGRIVAVGYSWDDGPPHPRNFRFAVARYSADGSLDMSFDGDGRAATAINSIEGRVAGATTVAIQPDGKIVAGGYSYDGLFTNSTLVRYETKGGVDPTFGTDGIAVTAFSQDSDSYTTDVSIQTDGRIVVAGWSNNVSFGYAAPSGFGLARYNTEGSLDPTFGAGGKILTSFSPGNWGSYEAATAIQSDGKIVLAGYIGPHSALFRYVGRSEFASISGRVTSPNGSGLRNAAVSLTDGQGVIRTVITSSLGFYSFDTVKVDSSYTIAVSSKRYRFAARSLQMNTDLTNIDFVGVE